MEEVVKQVLRETQLLPVSSNWLVGNLCNLLLLTVEEDEQSVFLDERVNCLYRLLGKHRVVVEHA